MAYGSRRCKFFWFDSNGTVPCLRPIARCHSASSSSQEGISKLVGLALMAVMDTARTGCGIDMALRLSVHRWQLGSAKFSQGPLARRGWLARLVMWLSRRCSCSSVLSLNECLPAAVEYQRQHNAAFAAPVLLDANTIFNNFDDNIGVVSDGPAFPEFAGVVELA